MLASSRACPVPQVTAQMLKTVLYLDSPPKFESLRAALAQPLRAIATL